MFEPITACRVCGFGNFRPVLDLGMLAPCGVFPKTPEDDPPKRPLEVIQCADCGLVQLRHNAPPEETFNDGFGYRSGTNAQMVRHLKELADFAVEKAALQDGDTVIDIGANDGTFLGFLPRSVGKVGVDPTINKYRDAWPEDAVIVSDFWSADVAEWVGKAKAITCFACLYDLPDPNAFVAAVADALTDDGVFIGEVAYWPAVEQAGGFDIISHEHLMYFDQPTLCRLFERSGMAITEFKETPTNGGSVLFVARREPEPSIAALRRAYPPRNAPPSPSHAFYGPLTDAMFSACAFFADNGSATIHGLGASTRFNTALQFFGITANVIAAISDANPDKHGRYTPGTLIPIISEEESRAQNPDYYVVGPWHFRDEIIKREAAFLERGGKLVFLLPEFEIVSASSRPQAA